MSDVGARSTSQFPHRIAVRRSVPPDLIKKRKTERKKENLEILSDPLRSVARSEQPLSIQGGDAPKMSYFH